MEPNIEKEFYSKYNEPFQPLEDLEILNEMENLITNIDVKKQVIFRANHASNVYSIRRYFTSRQTANTRKN